MFCDLEVILEIVFCIIEEDVRLICLRFIILSSFVAVLALFLRFDFSLVSSRIILSFSLHCLSKALKSFERDVIVDS